jgi:hypothetical protein
MTPPSSYLTPSPSKRQRLESLQVPPTPRPVRKESFFVPISDRDAEILAMPTLTHDDESSSTCCIPSSSSSSGATATATSAYAHVPRPRLSFRPCLRSRQEFEALEPQHVQMPALSVFFDDGQQQDACTKENDHPVPTLLAPKAIRRACSLTSTSSKNKNRAMTAVPRFDLPFVQLNYRRSQSSSSWVTTCWLKIILDRVRLHGLKNTCNRVFLLKVHLMIYNVKKSIIPFTVLYKSIFYTYILYLRVSFVVL